MMKNILVIDDDTYICNLLTNYLKQNGFSTEGVLSGIAALKLIDNKAFDLILCDYRLPDIDGLEMLKHIQSKNASIPIVIMTAYAEVKMAVKLIKAGAFDYVTKPIHPDEILHLIKKAIAISEKKNTQIPENNEFITGSSEQIKNVMHHVSVVAPTELTVLIEGETGSGKEYIARAIHNASSRSTKPFIAVDCGAIPKELANSELYGHIKGAFTGAVSDKIGYFEQADGGTLFLDEVGNLPYENQVKLLRSLQERIISRVGDNKTVKIDVRLIAATNDNLMQSVNDNEFREDLYHRLNEFKIKLPPLRERKQDIMEFVHFFLTKANQSFGKDIQGIDESVEMLFLQYPWYGNIRELQNIINRAALLSTGNVIKTDVLPEELKGLSHSPLNNNADVLPTDLKQATESTEKETILQALITANHNKSKAAKILNIDRKTLYNKIKLYDLLNG